MKKKKKSKKYNLLMFNEKGSTKIKRFDSTEDMGKFIDQFNKEYPNYLSNSSDEWIDFAVTGVTGDVHFFTDGIEVE